MATVTIKDRQQFTVGIAPKSKAGNPAPVQGIPAWSSSDETVLLVTPAEDGMSAVVKAVGPTGAASVKVSADADLGEGVKTIEGILNVGVEAGEAADFGFVVGDVTEQPEVPPSE
jgi:hypothetical protein